MLYNLTEIFSSRAQVLKEKGSLFNGQISYRLLKCAPLMLNEVIFFHRRSSTLLVADAYYSGHCCNHYGQENINNVGKEFDNDQKVAPPNVFTRFVS